MEVFFYCNYANSKAGFQLTRLKSGKLVSTSLFNSGNKGELLIDRFFSYDLFRVLWTEIPTEDSKPFKAEAQSSFFGIRGLTGTISDRSGYLNIAFLSGKDEILETEYLARGILTDIRKFTKETFLCLSVGGETSYELDSARFSSLIDRTINSEYRPLPITETLNQSNTTLRSLLKFGVLSDSWEAASSLFEPKWLWKLRPGQVIDDEEFKKFI